MIAAMEKLVEKSKRFCCPKGRYQRFPKPRLRDELMLHALITAASSALAEAKERQRLCRHPGDIWSPFCPRCGTDLRSKEDE